MPDLATRLTEAEAALHDLQRGAAVRTVRDQNGEEIAYRGADVPRLSAYVGALRREAAGKKPVRGFIPKLTRGL